MRRTARKIIILGVFSAAFLCISGTESFALEKKDVSDPVLNEILAFFSRRMPRFINQHGQDVFVADGPVTRGNFISAMYEYDRSLKFAPRQEVNELKEKVASLEKSQSSCDINKIIAELQLSMPAMLDKSLNSSKVFLNLKTEAAKKQEAEPQASQGKMLADNLAELTKRVEKLESAPSSSQAAAPAVDLSGLSNRLSVLENKVTVEKTSVVTSKAAEKDIDNLSKRIGVLEAAQPQNLAFQKSVPRIEERLSSVESSAAADKLSSGQELSELSKRIGKIETGNTGQANIKRDLARLEERISSLEKGMSSQSSVSNSKPVSEDYSALSQRIDKLEANETDLKDVRKSLSMLEARIGSAEKASPSEGASSNNQISALNKRIEKLENAVPAPGLSQLEKRVGILERSSAVKPAQPELPRDLSKKLDAIDYLIDQNKELGEKLGRVEDRLNNLSAAGGATEASQPQARVQDLADLDKRLGKVEIVVNEYIEIERLLSKLEARVDSIEKVSSLANVSSSEELSDLSKRVGELERIQQNAQNK